MTLTSNERQLVRRYLIWCYKTTKEDLDRVDRYYTQFLVDQFVLDCLNKNKNSDADYKKLVKNFEEYMAKKRANVDIKKFQDPTQNKLNPDYQYLHNRFLAIKKAIIQFLGKKELTKIINLYEEEMTNRILTAREH